MTSCGSLVTVVRACRSDEPPGTWLHPLVSSPAADGISVAVTCRMLAIAR